MSKFNGLDRMSSKDLASLQQRIAVAIVNKQASEKSDLKRKLEELAAQSGFNVNELFGARTSSLKGSKVAVKFRNPKDDTQTWTGRGRKPRWLVAALDAGNTVEECRIGRSTLPDAIPTHQTL